MTRSDIARYFGDAFADDVAALELGVWSGPLTSPFGVHLVRVEERQRAAPYVIGCLAWFWILERAWP